MKQILLLTTLSILTHFISASDSESIPPVQPCSKDECHKLREVFDKQSCQRGCRNNAIIGLARRFDPKKDIQYLRALVCANKSYHNPNYTDPVNEIYFFERGDRDVFIYYKTGDEQLFHKYHHYRNRNWKQKFSADYNPYAAPIHLPVDENNNDCDTLSVIDTAVEHNNFVFLKAFFDLFPKQYSHVSKLSTNALPVVQSKEMTEFFLKKKIYLINKAEACPEEHRVQSQDRPGCPILAAHINKVNAEYKKEKQEKREALDRKLREAVSAAQK